MVLAVSLLAVGPGTVESSTELIAEIEVNQVMSYARDIDDGTLDLMENFVAGKNTAVIVALSREVEVDAGGDAQYVTVERDGETIATLTPRPAAENTDRLEFIPASRDQVDFWAAGTYVFTAHVDGEEQQRQVEFRERGDLNILAVPVRANYSGDVRTVEGDWRQGHSFLSQVYPVANDGVNWVLSPELDASADKYDLTTDAGMYQLWQALANLQTRDNSGQPAYDLIVGFVSDHQGPEGGLMGYTFGAPANIVTESDEDMLATVAHEIAHNYDVGDEYPGGALNPDINPPPYGVEGDSWDRTTQVRGDRPFFKADNARFGPMAGVSIEAEDFRPYEYGGRGHLADMVSFMGGGGPLQKDIWISSPVWDHLFVSLAPEDEPVVDPTPGVRVIEASGKIRSDGEVVVNPWYSWEMDEDDLGYEEGSGPYSIEARDGEGQALARQEFDVSFFTMTHDRFEKERAPFEVIMEFPEDTESFAIMEGDEVLKTLEVSPHTPTASFVNLEGGETLAGEVTVEWEASDEDGNELFYELWYSIDGKYWEILAADITETSWTVDFDQLGGSDDARLALYATDGINTVEVESETFIVASKAPQVDIVVPEGLEDGILVLEEGEELWLEVEAYDLQDGWLNDEDLVWTDSWGTVLYYGDVIYYDYLASAEYEVTLTATNSRDLGSEETILIRVVDPETGQVAEHEPSDWARDRVRQAEEYLIVPGSVMVYYQESITREEFTEMVVTIIEVITEDEFEVVEENPFTDTDNDYIPIAYDLGLVSGVAEDRFAPDQPINRQELSAIFNRTLELLLDEEALQEIDAEAGEPFTAADSDEVAPWARQAMARLYALEVIREVDGVRLTPLAHLSREEAIILSLRFYELFL